MFQVPAKFATNIQGKNFKLPPKGSPSARVWVVPEAPLEKDKDKGFLFSSPMGWSFDKLLREAGLNDYYTVTFEDKEEARTELLKYQPPIIVPLDGAGILLTDKIKDRSSVNTWAGSLLNANYLPYQHYVIPTFGPEKCISDWTERQIVKFIDLGKVVSELEFFQRHGILQQLPSRQLVTDLDFEVLCFKLEQWLDPSYEFLSVDIESEYPRASSKLIGVYPGCPVVVGIAISKDYGISFELFREDMRENIRLWKLLARLLESKWIIGQNFMNFDCWIFEMLGMRIDRFKIHDTMFRHAVLWPELSHKLEFMTRQYTREPYYKSEGHHWTMKDLSRLKLYNAKDVTVTYEVFEQEEEEFNVRPHLR